MDCYRHHRELGRPQHHHWLCGFARRFLCESGEEFGMPWLGKTRAVEHVLGHRIGDDSGGISRQHVSYGAAD